MKNSPLQRIASMALVLTASIGSSQAAPTRITAPQAIKAPGSYILANDITSTSPGAAIDIQASDVTLNLNGHTITTQGDGVIIEPNDINNNNSPVVNAHVSNGQIVAAAHGLIIFASSCLVNGLNVTVGQSGTAIVIEHGNFNRVNSCVLAAATGQTAGSAFSLFLTSHNTIQNNILAGVFNGTIGESDQAGASATVVGDNTFSGNQFANPTQ